MSDENTQTIDNTANTTPLAEIKTTVSEDKEKDSESLRATLEKAYDKHDSEAREAEAPQVEKKRSETGKFIKSGDKVTEFSKPKKAPELSLGKVETEEGVTDEAFTESTTFEPPRSYTTEEKEFFKTLDPVIQKRLVAIDDGVYQTHTRKMREIGIKERQYRELDDVTAPYEAEWQKAGLNAGRVLSNYIGWEKSFHENPHQTILDLAATKGLSLEDLASYTSEKNPEVEALKKEVQQLKQGTVQQQENLVDEYQEFLNSEVERFAGEIGEDGKPLRPYFQQVYEHMLPIAEVYRNNNPNVSYETILEASYRDACKLHPEVYKKVMEDEFKTWESRKLANQSEEAKRARLSASSLSGTPNGNLVVDNKNSSLREDLERAWDKHVR